MPIDTPRPHHSQDAGRAELAERTASTASARSTQGADSADAAIRTSGRPDPLASLGSFLRDRRERLQPGPDAPTRRRTPGLRREEVAARANVSVAWYTWLEQGRGGPPSSVVLERLAKALELDAAGRELLFLLAQQRPPPRHGSEPSAVTPALQRVLDGMRTSPAIVKTPTWDIVAWNEAATRVLGDYSALPPRDRNLLRRLFGDPKLRAAQREWEESARLTVAVFRVDVARAPDCPAALELAAELMASSADFRRLWAQSDVRSHWGGVKRIQHPLGGPITLEYSPFAVDGAEGLSMIVFAPLTADDQRALESIMAGEKPAS